MLIAPDEPRRLEKKAWQVAPSEKNHLDRSMASV
jgi:hypothetical protein